MSRRVLHESERGGARQPGRAARRPGGAAPGREERRPAQRTTQRTGLFAAVLFAALVGELPMLARPAHGQVQNDGSYGFLGPQVFKFHRGVGPVAIGDVDGDGVRDLAVVDNARAELVLISRAPGAAGERDDVTGLSDPDGTRRTTLLLTRKVEALAIADLDGDGSNDLLLHDPGLLEVRWGGGAEPHGARQRIRLPESLPGPEALVVQTDEGAAPVVFVLARRGVHRLQGFARERAPERALLPSGTTKATRLRLVDLDGDGRRDLLQAVDDSPRPFHIRLATGAGRFGPLRAPEATAPGEVIALRRPDGADSLISLHADRGRFEELELSVHAAATDRLQLDTPEVIPLDAEGLESPVLLLADLDADGDADIAVPHRKQGTILVLRNDGGSLTPLEPAPTLRRVTSICAHTPQGEPPLLVATSAEEGVVGASHLEGDFLGFPSALPATARVAEKPRLATSGSFTRAGASELVILGGENRRTLSLLTRGADGSWSPRQGLQVLGATTDPRDLLSADLDGDGRQELLVFVPFEAPRLFRVGSSGAEATAVEWQRVEAPGTLERADRGQVHVTRDGDLLVASGHHARRIRLRDTLEVLYQVNAPTGSAQIACAVEARLRGPLPDLVLVDRVDRAIHIYESAEGSPPRLLRSIRGPYADTRDAAVADLDGDGIDEVAILGERTLAVLRAGGRRFEWTSLHLRSCARSDGRYTSAATGDLNGDGEPDLALVDGSRHFIEIHRRHPQEDWALALSFPVFESNTFRGASGNVIEPRGLWVADVTGDRFDDIVILVHDRVIVYPQDE